MCMLPGAVGFLSVLISPVPDVGVSVMMSQSAVYPGIASCKVPLYWDLARIFSVAFAYIFDTQLWIS